MLKSRSGARVSPRAFLFIAFFLSALAAPAVLPAQQGEAEPEAPVLEEESYELGPGDRVQVTVHNQADLSGDFVLDGNGRISMPLIGTVAASGLTAAQLQDLLVDRFKPDYLVNPRVTVRILNYRPYYIIGEVASTGQFPYVAGMTYLTAIAIAGGYTYRAKKDIVYVIRGDDPEREEIKLEVYRKVQPGDIIRVDERLF